MAKSENSAATEAEAVVEAPVAAVAPKVAASKVAPLFAINVIHYGDNQVAHEQAFRPTSEAERKELTDNPLGVVRDLSDAEAALFAIMEGNSASDVIG